MDDGVQDSRGSESVMWKSITLRRPLRRPEEKAPSDTAAFGGGGDQDHPFADLMAKLDKIPYRRKLRCAFGR
ncbi:hypothetical protein [Sphingobium sp. HWE2-09]|uniref:hypothetical protein n=1 Tax=Sphingobium sp. HWE2-09 TaxID=3108390 RepID=UPI002DCBAEB5|nr:hypothetical protein [Sphingobium sp. HWE2-09]